MVTADAVDPYCTRKFASPGFMIPVSAPDPAITLRGICIMMKYRNEFSFGFGIPQINIGQIITTIQKVYMIIYKSRHHHFTLQINQGGMTVSIWVIVISNI